MNLTPRSPSLPSLAAACPLSTAHRREFHPGMPFRRLLLLLLVLNELLLLLLLLLQNCCS